MQIEFAQIGLKTPILSIHKPFVHDAPLIPVNETLIKHCREDMRSRARFAQV